MIGVNMTSVTVRLDEETKRQASHVLEGLGLDISTATRAFYRQIVLQNGLPFSVTYPATTLSAAAQKRFDRADAILDDGNPGFTTPDELFRALDI
jgi:DNA-damage-inducible protein J